MDAHPPYAYADPAIAIIVEAYAQSGQPFLIVNEHHAVEWHRHVSACILDAATRVRPMTFGAEAIPSIPPVRTDIAADRRSRGYRGSNYFQHLWRVALRHDMVIFGYDPHSADQFSDEELAARGLSGNLPNPRDAKAAETILEVSAQRPDSGVYLHVGHAHVLEGWNENEYGGSGWLAAHLARLTGHDHVTVDQISREDAAFYESRGAFQFDLSQCGRGRHDIPALRTEVGVVGCVDYSRIAAGGRYADFVILDGAEETDRAPDRPYICEAHRHDYARR